jgi:hypothetical protein
LAACYVMKRDTGKFLFIVLCFLPLAAFLIPVGSRPRFQLAQGTQKVLDWLLPAIAGAVFTTLGLLKVYGWQKGIVGGGGKPTACRLLGRCPSWSNQLNIAVITVFLSIGAVSLGLSLVVLLKR